ncbi:HET domain-containing protein [Microdochium nivale]|nr:HET domain-containing protein [Microdochium nivale]
MRLVQLKHAGAGSIEGEYIVQSLDSPDLTPYEVVSYVWESPDLCKTITIDGRELGVARNANEMLSSLRRGEHGYLWIDAICINQRDVAERNHQVQQMSRIYALANKVIVYLGRPTADTNLLMGSLSEVQSALGPHHYDFGEYEQEWAHVQERISLEVPDADEQQQRNAVDDLFSRPYWERAWIVQEVSHPVDGTVYCGDWAVSCDIFILALWLFQVTPSSHVSQIIGTMPTRFREALYHGGDHDLHSVLLRYREAKASDERDRIYALLGLVHEDDNRPPLVVDYAQTEAEVVRHASAHICRCGDVDILPLGTTAPTVAVFLESLHNRTLHRDILRRLKGSTHGRAAEGVAFILREAPRKMMRGVTAGIVRDAEQNPVHRDELRVLLSN